MGTPDRRTRLRISHVCALRIGHVCAVSISHVCATPPPPPPPPPATHLTRSAACLTFARAHCGTSDGTTRHPSAPPVPARWEAECFIHLSISSTIRPWLSHHSRMLGQMQAAARAAHDAIQA
ncbi:hypothetical protein E2P81_ATG10948 [Venturia nashicola]|nr:hypothetical protein E2P81_ATG10948 [Venturia nashicola]